MIAFIINYNRLTLTVNMANWLAVRNIEPVIIDNNSDYQPLLEYYESTPYQVIKVKQNFGHLVVWKVGILSAMKVTGSYIVSDPDLDLSGIPDDFLHVLQEGIRKYPRYPKCGFSLEVNDWDATGWERSLWERPLDDKYFIAPIDTTFALYKTKHFDYLATRTNRPYTARHLPFYYDKISDLPEDEQYYIRTANGSFSSKGRIKQ